MAEAVEMATPVHMLMIYTSHAGIKNLPFEAIVICRPLRHVVGRIEQVYCGSQILCRGNLK
jgi:hypothetical protein